MGASLSDWLAHRLRLTPPLRRQLLVAGVSGGFGAVFGTPLAGAIFGLELCRLVRPRIAAASLVASLVGDGVCRALGATHTELRAPAPAALGLILVGKWLLCAAAVAATSTLFIEAKHGCWALFERGRVARPLRPLLGGVAVLGLWQLAGTSAPLGLGIPMLTSALSDGTLPATTWLWKLALTVVTLGSGFIGGEVTPLFVVGATLGNLLGRLLGIPFDLAAGVGLAALYGCAARTPLALSCMAVELFGPAILPHVLLVSVGATLLGGGRTLYPMRPSTAGTGLAGGSTTY
jgi:H+/Cl- antiporter ClcA